MGEMIKKCYISRYDLKISSWNLDHWPFQFSRKNVPGILKNPIICSYRCLCNPKEKQKQHSVSAFRKYPALIGNQRSHSYWSELLRTIQTCFEFYIYFLIRQSKNYISWKSKNIVIGPSIWLVQLNRINRLIIMRVFWITKTLRPDDEVMQTSKLPFSADIKCFHYVVIINLASVPDEH